MAGQVAFRWWRCCPVGVVNKPDNLIGDNIMDEVRLDGHLVMKQHHISLVFFEGRCRLLHLFHYLTVKSILWVNRVRVIPQCGFPRQLQRTSLSQRVVGRRTLSVKANSKSDEHGMPSHPSFLFTEGLTLFGPEHLEEGVGDVLRNEDILERLVERIVDWHTFCCQLLQDGGLVLCELPHGLPTVSEHSH